MDTPLPQRMTLFLLLLSLIPSISTQSTPSSNLDHLVSRVSPQIQEESAQDVLKRLLPSRFTEFRIKVDPSLTSSPYEDAFEISADPTGKILVVGTTGVSAVFGLNYYLKYFCHAHVSWEGNQLSLPQPLPRPRVTLRKKILDRFRYYQNVCTESYSFVWWEWDRWEIEIDWMGLHGINLPLAFTGQEAIWAKVYAKLGLSPTEIQEYISGPAFLAWWRMGNLQKWGGPIPASYVDGKLVLLEKILERMRSLGMLPVLPAFSGNVPQGLISLFPNSTFDRHPSWNNFNSSYSETYMLEPTDPLFLKIGKMFINELTNLVGTDHVYSSDAYNENRPGRNDSEFLRAVSEATFKSMTDGDPNAVWMMQAWIFTDFGFWSKERVEAFLSGVEIGNLLILDLQAESLPLWIAFDSFFNHSFIWCMLHNFGGTMNFYGNMDEINRMLPLARQSSSNGTLVGIGLTPEGIDQNSVMYEFMTEMTLHPQPIDTTKWITKYSTRRYGFSSGFLEAAWQILQRGVFNNVSPGYRNHGRSILTHRPLFNNSEAFWYNPQDISVALGHFLTEGTSDDSPALNSSLYKHDLVDLTRQFLIHLGGFGYEGVMEAYHKGDTLTFWTECEELLEVLDDLDLLLSTNDKFLLGKWTRDAEEWGQGEQEKKLLRYNSLVQITTWGPGAEILDYASKQWAGLVSDYLKPRWTLFLDLLDDSHVGGRPFNTTEFNHRALTEVELPFTLSNSNFPTLPTGNEFETALRIYKKWRRKYDEGNPRRSQGQMEPRMKGHLFSPSSSTQEDLAVFGSVSQLGALVGSRFSGFLDKPPVTHPLEKWDTGCRFQFDDENLTFHLPLPTRK